MVVRGRWSLLRHVMTGMGIGTRLHVMLAMVHLGHILAAAFLAVSFHLLAARHFGRRCGSSLGVRHGRKGDRKRDRGQHLFHFRAFRETVRWIDFTHAGEAV